MTMFNNFFFYSHTGWSFGICTDWVLKLLGSLENVIPLKRSLVHAKANEDISFRTLS